MNKCKDCKEWRNKQRELDYVADYGICTGIFENGEPDMIKIIPHEEFHLTIPTKHQNDDYSIRSYDYEFCTYESFGCSHWVKS